MIKQCFNLNKVRGIRSENHNTQEELAKLLGISTNSYASKENGIIDFKVDELVQIANLYNVPINVFFESKVHANINND